MLTLERQPHQVEPAELAVYKRLGHSGYIINYRRRHEGKDPDSLDLAAINEKTSQERLTPPVRFIKRLLDLLT